MSIGHLYVLFGEMSLQVLCPFINWIVCLFVCWCLVVKFGCYTSLVVSLANIFFQLVDCLFVSLMGFFCCAKTLIKESYLR